MTGELMASLGSMVKEPVLMPGVTSVPSESKLKLFKKLLGSAYDTLTKIIIFPVHPPLSFWSEAIESEEEILSVVSLPPG